MRSSISDITALNATYAQARQLAPETHTHVVLHLGDTESRMAWGTGDQPAHHSSLPLGLSGLANRISSNGRLSESAMEQMIAEVEDIVMPLHAKLPASGHLFSADAVFAELAKWAGATDKTTQWKLSTDAVEHLFNRQVALAQGRPASQDDLPTTGEFSAALLVLREWLHHLHFDGITILGIPEPETKLQTKPELVRS